MLQTVIILIGKYQFKDDVSLVVKPRVFYTKHYYGIGRSWSNFIQFFMDDFIIRLTILSILNPRTLNES